MEENLNNTNENQDVTTNVETNAQVLTETTEHHEGPHIPKMQGEQVYGPISNTALTTFLFFIIVLVVSLLGNKALKSNKKSRLKAFFISFVKFFDGQLRDAFGDKAFARKYYALVIGMFFIILFGNLLGLVIDWVGASISPAILQYFRPMHSDLNTTLVLSVMTVVMFLAIGIKSNGGLKLSKSYFFNWTGDGVAEKCINVFVGWLHLIGIPSTLASLSLRLFGNIFAGIVLIGVISYLGAYMTHGAFEVGRLLSIPFWFFEVFVALVQAVVFMFLMISYFMQAKEDSH